MVSPGQSIKVSVVLTAGLLLFLFTTPGEAGAVLLDLTTPPIDNGVIINIPSFTLFFIADGRVAASYPIAVGRRRTWVSGCWKVTETPTGRFLVSSRTTEPAWHPPLWLKEARGWPADYVMQAGPDNPLGSRWIGLNLAGYGIHGTNRNESIGSAVSLGCIRMSDETVKELYELVEPGDPVLIMYQRAVVYRDSATGEPQLQLLPDPYQTGPVLLPELEQSLARLGFEWPGPRLQAALDRVEAEAVEIPLRANDSLVINGTTVGKVLVERAETSVPRVLVQLERVLQQLGLSTAELHENYAVVEGRPIQLTSSEHSELMVEWRTLSDGLQIGGEWVESTSTLYLWNVSVNLFGYVATQDAFRQQEREDVYVNIRRLAAGRLARYFTFEAEQEEARVLGETVRVQWRGGNPYVSAKSIATCFRANLYWNAEDNTAAILYR